MTSIQWIPALMFMTLAAAAGFGLLQLIWFMERRSNQRIAEEALVGGSGSSHGPGALPEIASVSAVLVVAMALLVTGYNMRSDSGEVATAPSASSPPTPAAATDRMSDPPKERANPADMAQPPTQYPLGSGSATDSVKEPAMKEPPAQ